MSSTTHGALAERYGKSERKSRRARRLITAAVAVLIALAVIWLIVVNRIGSSGDLSTTNTAYDIIDAHHVSVSFTISTTVAKPVSCALESTNDSYTVVGWKIVSYPASKQQTRSFTEVVRTMEKGTSGLISRCWLT